MAGDPGMYRGTSVGADPAYYNHHLHPTVPRCACGAMQVPPGVAVSDESGTHSETGCLDQGLSGPLVRNPFHKHEADREWNKPLNPPPEPEMTFEDWYAEHSRLVNELESWARMDRLSESTERADAKAALLAHARKRIKP